MARKLKTANGVTLGMLETLWHFVSRYKPSGGLTRLDFDDAMDSGGFASMFDIDEVFEVMQSEECRWIDDLGDGQYYVHDWHAHSEDNIDNSMARSGTAYANGTIPRMTRLRKEERAELVAKYGWDDTTKSPSPEPEKAPDTTPDDVAHHKKPQKATAFPSQAKPSQAKPSQAKPEEEDSNHSEIEESRKPPPGDLLSKISTVFREVPGYARATGWSETDVGSVVEDFPDIPDKRLFELAKAQRDKAKDKPHLKQNSAHCEAPLSTFRKFLEFERRDVQAGKTTGSPAAEDLAWV